MYAVIESGSSQFQVQKGDMINIDLLDIPQDQKITFKKVLLCNDGTKNLVGTPHLENCIVTGEIVGENKGPKVIAFVYKRRKNYHRKKGHRQKYLKVKITDIQLN